MDMIPSELVWIVGSTIFGGGAAWGGSKVALNGTKARVEKLEASQPDVIDRLARIETKLDYLTKNAP